MYFITRKDYTDYLNKKIIQKKQKKKMKMKEIEEITGLTQEEIEKLIVN